MKSRLLKKLCAFEGAEARGLSAAAGSSKARPRGPSLSEMEAQKALLTPSTQEAQKAAAEKQAQEAGKASNRLPEARRGEGDGRSEYSVNMIPVIPFTSLTREVK